MGRKLKFQFPHSNEYAHCCLLDCNSLYCDKVADISEDPAASIDRIDGPGSRTYWNFSTLLQDFTAAHYRGH